MKQLLLDYYLPIKALHVIAVIAWMAGLFYCPRLFVYHTETRAGAPDHERFVRMERRLLKMIMAPAAIAAWIFGLMLAWLGDWWAAPWFELKLALVVAMTLMHVNCVVWQRAFAAGTNRHPARYFKMWNEVPTVLMIAIVVLVVTKPF